MRSEFDEALNRGHAHVIRDELDEAIAAYTEAIRISPDRALAYHCRSYAYLAKGENVKAIEDYAKSNRLLGET